MPATTTSILADLSKYRRRQYDAGETIIYAGEEPHGLYFIISGKVTMHDYSPKGNEVVVNVYEPGRFFPLGWALNGTPVKFFHKAEVTTEVIIVPREDAIEYISTNPEVNLYVMRKLFSKTDRMLQRMAYLMAASAARRLLYELLVECNLFGKVEPDGSCRVPLREVDIAGRTGLSRETVSREFHKFKEQGLITMDKKGIVVRSVQELSVIVGAIP